MAPRSTRPTSPEPPKVKFDLSAITTKGNSLPNRYILHGREGWGKTSFAAQTPKPIFLETRGETGLETLIDANQLADVPHFPEVQNWTQLLGYIDALCETEHQYKTLVIDTLNGAERLCHEHVCTRDFSGNWTDSGFMGYMRGYEVSLADWRQLLTALDRLRETKRMGIMALVHTKIKPYKNPSGADYDRFAPDMHDKTWSLSHRWADSVLFGNFDVTLTAVQENKKTGSSRGKAVGGKFRILYTENDAAYDAKNRLGLAPEIEMGDSPKEAWNNFVAALKLGREGIDANGQ